MQLSEQELRRRHEREALLEMGINPYPSELFDVTASAKEIKDFYKPELNNYQEVTLAGRLMSRRIMGKASFAELMDSSGRIQIYVSRDDIAPGENKELYNTVFKKMLDIGDIIGIKGYVFTTQVGEISVHVTELVLLTKSLKPLPIVKEAVDEQGNKVTYDAFSDPELRYRQRYVDLIVNPAVKDTFIKRDRKSTRLNSSHSQISYAVFCLKKKKK